MQEILLLLVLLTQVVVVEAASKVQLQMAHPAAPASSSSSTTSALPQSSPSSPRRSGLHQRVRWALTTSLLRVVGVVVANGAQPAAAEQAVSVLETHWLLLRELNTPLQLAVVVMAETPPVRPEVLALIPYLAVSLLPEAVAVVAALAQIKMDWMAALVVAVAALVHQPVLPALAILQAQARHKVQTEARAASQAHITVAVVAAALLQQDLPAAVAPEETAEMAPPRPFLVAA
jgi:hypothetical protein